MSPRTCAFVLLLIMTLAAAGLTIPAAEASTSPAWLTRVNKVRADAGLPPVRADVSEVAGIKAHLTYLRMTPSSLLRGKYASAHTENPGSRYYSAAGTREGSRSDLAFSSSSDVDAINSWLKAPFHAIGLLRERLTQVGFYRDPVTGFAGLDVISHLDLSRGPGRTIVYPRRSLDLARAGGEVPSPIDTCRRQHPRVNWSRPAFPIITMIAGLRSYRTITAAIIRPNGAVERRSHELCVVDLRTYVSPDRVYGAVGRSILTSDHVILLISPRPLTRGRYTVHVGLGAANNGRRLAWSFLSTAS